MKQVTKKQFEHMYNTMTVKAMALQFGVTTQTIQNYRNKLGIKSNGKGNTPKLIIKDS